MSVYFKLIQSLFSPILVFALAYSLFSKSFCLAHVPLVLGKTYFLKKKETVFKERGRIALV